MEVTISMDEKNYLQFLEFAGKFFNEEQLKQLRGVLVRHEVFTVKIEPQDAAIF